jgi:hypothetical protein
VLSAYLDFLSVLITNVHIYYWTPNNGQAVKETKDCRVDELVFMNCILLFHFVLLLISITLLILSISTSRWIVYTNKNSIGTISEYSNGIIVICQRFYHQGNTDRYSFINNSIGSNSSINDEVYVCFNRLSKWYNPSINGPELLSKLMKSISLCNVI